jgi:hypothetical protein
MSIVGVNDARKIGSRRGGGEGLEGCVCAQRMYTVC